MTRRRLVPWALSLVLCGLSSSACLVSTFHPLYDDASLVFDDSLIGTWENRESQVTVVVARSEWRSYKIDYTERTTTTHFTGFLTDLNRARFITLRPEDGLERPAYLVATHGPLQLMSGRNELRVRELDYDEVQARLRAGTLRIAAATDLRQNIVITADTPALRRWMGAALADAALWGEWKTLTRR